MRWVKALTTAGGPCKQCGSPTVRLRTLSPVPRAESLGGVAGFQLCRQCDRVQSGPVLR